MAYGKWMAAALLAAAPAMAEEIAFQGHALETQGSAAAREVVQVRGTRYAIPGTPSQIVAKAQLCLSTHDSGAGVISTDPAGGRLVAIGRVELREPVPRTVKGRLVIAADTGGFGVTLGGVGVAAAASGDGAEEVFLPVIMRDGSGWEDALRALIG